MSTVVPSQVVEFIDAALSFRTGLPRDVRLDASVCGAVNALLRLIDELPNPLLPREANTYAHFILSVESIRVEVRTQETRDYKAAIGPPQFTQISHLQRIRDALATCPDEVPPLHSRELPFITPPDFRALLLIDLEATRSALSHGEWKAATVLSGSLVEALLLWAILEMPTECQTAYAALRSAGKLKKRTTYTPLDWGLHEFVEIAKRSGLIEPETAEQARLAQDFRNLIHPGRVLRQKQTCDRGTALGTSAAVELVSRDLKARFP
jgi:hypothetical protein